MNKEIFEDAMIKKNMSKMRISMKAGISPADFYTAYSGRKPFYPRWRRALSEVLDIDEKLLFPDECEKGGSSSG